MMPERKTKARLRGPRGAGRLQPLKPVNLCGRKSTRAEGEARSAINQASHCDRTLQGATGGRQAAAASKEAHLRKNP